MASALEIAVPFLLTALVTFVGCFTTLLVLKRMEEEYEANVEEAKGFLRAEIEELEAKLEESERRPQGPDPAFPTAELSPATLASNCNWALDGASILAGVLGPGIGLSLLVDDLGPVAIGTYSIVIGVTLIGLVSFLIKVPVAGYENSGIQLLRLGRRRVALRSIGPVTPVATIIILVNILVGAGVLVVAE